MMYNRQKKMLGLLEEFGGRLGKTDMQKYLFLLSEAEHVKSYSFVPYNYGCFSFQAYEDKRKLTSQGILVECEDWRLAPNQRQFKDLLSYEDRQQIWTIRKEFGELRGNDLLEYIYKTFPYYAIKSCVASEILSKEDLIKVEKSRPSRKGRMLLSIGYEARSLEEYLNLLLMEDIKVLCDVRKKPFSRKYGFSKKTLQNALKSLDIEYVHFPSLGIETDKRRSLNSQNDYDLLFEEYEGTVLVKEYESLKQLQELLINKCRIAVTCFEKMPAMCHRTKVAKSVLALEKENTNYLEIV